MFHVYPTQNGRLASPGEWEQPLLDVSLGSGGAGPVPPRIGGEGGEVIGGEGGDVLGSE